MTDMKRVTVALPDDIDKAILELKNTEEFAKSSYSEVIRVLLADALGCRECDEQTA